MIGEWWPRKPQKTIGVCDFFFEWFSPLVSVGLFLSKKKKRVALVNVYKTTLVLLCPSLQRQLRRTQIQWKPITNATRKIYFRWLRDSLWWNQRIFLDLKEFWDFNFLENSLRSCFELSTVESFVYLLDVSASLLVVYRDKTTNCCHSGKKFLSIVAQTSPD